MDYSNCDPKFWGIFSIERTEEYNKKMLTTIALKTGQINAFTLLNFSKTCITDCSAKKKMMKICKHNVQIILKYYVYVYATN